MNHVTKRLHNPMAVRQNKTLLSICRFMQGGSLSRHCASSGYARAIRTEDMKATANMANEQPRTADRGCYSRQALTNHHCYDMLQTVSNLTKLFARQYPVAASQRVIETFATKTAGNPTTRLAPVNSSRLPSIAVALLQLNSIRIILVLTT